ncbi:MAG TPA: S8 family serine peptidase [Nocardioides sp.]|nr:S8 family serine peptidase [Nocardioides sp.]
MRRLVGASSLLVLGLALAVSGNTAQARPQPAVAAGAPATAVGGTGEFVVFYADGTSAAQGRAAVRAAGGTVLAEVSQLGMAKVTTADAAFSRQALASGAVRAVVRNHSVGIEKQGMTHRFAEERALADRPAYAREAAAGKAGATGPKDKKSGPETFSWLQWDMEMIGATLDGAHRNTTGEGVLVGVIDTGIDGSHPDLAPNFDAARSRNFTTDIPEIDGPCETASCVDPADVDDGGHGTHVAGTIAAAYDGRGIAGVAPDATLVNVRAGQDSGYFFFFETVAALAYAGDSGLDVVNMSFYTDPWLYNCASAADYVTGAPTAAEIAQQAAIRAGVIEAVEYATAHGVTLVAAAGNQHVDLAAPTRFDDTSPDYPVGAEQARTVTSNCLDLPAEGPGVITVSSVGPSTVKADYSTWGLGSIDVAAPGGWFRDNYGTNDYREPENMILSTYPEKVATEEGAVNKAGGLKDPHFYLRECDAGDCAYYQYLQGTSMASPHVTGVAALIIAAHGTPDGSGVSLAPDAVRAYLTGTATPTACPDPALLDYTQEGRPASWNATCTGTTAYNSNYGFGIVDAQAATE